LDYPFFFAAFFTAFCAALVGQFEIGFAAKANCHPMSESTDAKTTAAATHGQSTTHRTVV
jgi:hypothetical protein